MTREEIADTIEDIIWNRISQRDALNNGDAVERAVEEIMKLWDMGFVYELDRPIGVVGDPQ